MKNAKIRPLRASDESEQFSHFTVFASLHQTLSEKARSASGSVEDASLPMHIYLKGMADAWSLTRWMLHVQAQTRSDQLGTAYIAPALEAAILSNLESTVSAAREVYRLMKGRADND